MTTRHGKYDRSSCSLSFALHNSTCCSYQRHANCSRCVDSRVTSCLWLNKQLRLHVELTKLRNASGKLQVCLDPFQDPHVRESDLLDELQFSVFRQGRDGLGHFEHGRDDVV